MGCWRHPRPSPADVSPTPPPPAAGDLYKNSLQTCRMSSGGHSHSDSWRLSVERLGSYSSSEPLTGWVALPPRRAWKQKNAYVHVRIYQHSLGLGFYETGPQEVWLKKSCMCKGPQGWGPDADDWGRPASRGWTRRTRRRPEDGGTCSRALLFLPATLLPGARSRRDVLIVFLGWRTGRRCLVEARVGPPSHPQRPHPDVSNCSPFPLSPGILRATFLPHRSVLGSLPHPPIH